METKEDVVETVQTIFIADNEFGDIIVSPSKPEDAFSEDAGNCKAYVVQKRLDELFHQKRGEFMYKFASGLTYIRRRVKYTFRRFGIFINGEEEFELVKFVPPQGSTPIANEVAIAATAIEVAVVDTAPQDANVYEPPFNEPLLNQPPRQARRPRLPDELIEADSDEDDIKVGHLVIKSDRFVDYSFTSCVSLVMVFGFALVLRLSFVASHMAVSSTVPSRVPFYIANLAGSSIDIFRVIPDDLESGGSVKRLVDVLVNGSESNIMSCAKEEFQIQLAGRSDRDSGRVAFVKGPVYEYLQVYLDEFDHLSISPMSLVKNTLWVNTTERLSLLGNHRHDHHSSQSSHLDISTKALMTSTITPVFYLTTAPSASWQSVASDSTGQYLVAVVTGEGIYTSANYGGTWSSTSAPSASWQSVASDSTGQYLVAVVNGGGVYTSANYGGTWSITSAPIRKWYSVASDSTGQYLVAVIDGEGIYPSANYGVTWTISSGGDDSWMSVASDSTGQYLVVVAIYGSILTSANYGVAWTPSSAPGERWQSVASDSTGQYLVAVVNGGGIYTSANYGGKWTSTSAPFNIWQSVASDSTGQYLVAVVTGGGVYTSANYGGAWSSTSAHSERWYSVASDSTGQYLVAVVNGGGIYETVSKPTGQPTSQPSSQPSRQPTSQPSSQPNSKPSKQPSAQPTSKPSTQPSRQPSAQPSSPTSQPSRQPSSQPSRQPTSQPSSQPNSKPSKRPSAQPTSKPSSQPNSKPSRQPSAQPTSKPSSQPSRQPSSRPSSQPNSKPSRQPSAQPTSKPSSQPSRQPTSRPSSQPNSKPSRQPSAQPTSKPSSQPSRQPSSRPSSQPNSKPSRQPSAQPTSQPSSQPNSKPSKQPSAQPTSKPSSQPTCPTSHPSASPTNQPSRQPSSNPTQNLPILTDSYTMKATTQGQMLTYSFTNLGYQNDDLYLTATLLISYLDSSSGGFVVITVGSGTAATVIASHSCAPNLACTTSSLKTCLVNFVIFPDMVSSEVGGSLTVSARTNTSTAQGILNPCTIEGQSEYFTIKFTLTSYLQPTTMPTPVPTSQSSQANSIFTAKGAPFYVIATFALAYIGLAVVLIRDRDHTPGLAKMTLLNACVHMGSLGYYLISEIYYVLFLFTADIPLLTHLAGVVLLSRLLSIVPCVYCLLLMMGPDIWSSYYSSILDRNHFLQQKSIMTVLLLLFLLEGPLLVMFPWKQTAFATLSGGFPDIHLFEVCMFPKLLQSALSLAVQIVVADIAIEAASDSSLALIILYLIPSVAVFIYSAVSVFIQVRLERIADPDVVATISKQESRGDIEFADTGFMSGINPLNGRFFMNSEVIADPVVNSAQPRSINPANQSQDALIRQIQQLVEQQQTMLQVMVAQNQSSEEQLARMQQDSAAHRQASEEQFVKMQQEIDQLKLITK